MKSLVVFKRLRFSIRSALLVTALLCVVSAWFGGVASRLRAASVASDWESRGISVRYAHYERPFSFPHDVTGNPVFSDEEESSWCVRLLGRHLAFDVVAVSLSSPRATRQDMKYLSLFEELQKCCLYGLTVGTAEIEQLAMLKRLKQLTLYQCRIEEGAFSNTDLAITNLWIADSHIPAKEFKSIGALPTLAALVVSGGNLRSDAWISLSASNCESLRLVSFGNTHIADRDISSFLSRHPHCQVMLRGKPVRAVASPN